MACPLQYTVDGFEYQFGVSITYSQFQVIKGAKYAQTISPQADTMIHVLNVVFDLQN